MKKLSCLVLLTLLLLSLGGCGLVKPKPQEIQGAYYGVYPSNYQAIIQKFMAPHLYDPYSAKYHWIKGPKKAWMSRFGTIHYGYGVVCAINAKNRLGGYVGMKKQQFMIRDGQVVLHGNYKGDFVE